MRANLTAHFGTLNGFGDSNDLVSLIFNTLPGDFGLTTPLDGFSAPWSSYGFVKVTAGTVAGLYIGGADFQIDLGYFNNACFTDTGLPSDGVYEEGVTTFNLPCTPDGAVPLPASAPRMLAGLGAPAALGRRRAA